MATATATRRSATTLSMLGRAERAAASGRPCRSTRATATDPPIARKPGIPWVAQRSTRVACGTDAERARPLEAIGRAEPRRHPGARDREQRARVVERAFDGHDDVAALDAEERLPRRATVHAELGEQE